MGKSAKANSARIIVDVSKRAAPVSRRLFGKFTEHLGANVYLGAWAQLVANPEFAPASRWMDREALNGRLGHFGEATGMCDLGDQPARGFAPFWAPVGAVAGELVGENGRDVQRLCSSGDGAIRTAVYLPLARVRAFDLSIRLRGNCPGGLNVDLSGRDGVLARASVPVGERWETREARLEVYSAATFRPGDVHFLTLRAGDGRVELDRVLLTPTDALDGWDPDVVAFLRRAKLPLLRFPGGNFVSGYHWTDGVGPIDSRPTLTNPAWGDVIEFNHVGTDEWLRLCELVGAEALICVNAGNGTPAEAREWIEYCNAPADTPLGAKRAANGRREPWNVKLWEIGNELYGGWQIGWVKAEAYAKRYAEFVAEMSKAGPDLHFIANGCDPAWNKTLVEKLGAQVASITEHSLPGWVWPADADPVEVYDDLMAFSAHYDEHIASLVRPMVEAGLVPRLAVTELQLLMRPPGLPRNHTMSEAVWTAGILLHCVKSGGIVELVTHSALVNHGGGLRKERGIVYANPVWWVTQLLSDQPCLIPAKTTVQSPAFDSTGKWMPPARSSSAVDAAALVDDSGKVCNVFVVNRRRTEAISVEIGFSDFDAASAETVTMSSDYLDSNTRQEPGRIRPRTAPVDVHAGGIKITVAPCSVTRITVR